MPDFITPRTRIAPCTLDHIPDILKMFSEPDSNKFIAPLLQMTPEQWKTKLEVNINKNEDFEQYWVAYHQDNGDFIGTLNLNKFADSDMDQIGIHLSSKYWNQGYGTELCTPILKYGFEQRKLPVIHWIFEEGHEASKNLASKLGFKQLKEMWDEEYDCNLFVFSLEK